MAYNDEVSFSIPKWLIVIGIIILVYLLYFYFTYSESAKQIDDLKLQLDNKQIEILSLQNRIQILEQENNRLTENYNLLKKATGDLVTNFFLQESFWAIMGREDIRLVCGFLKNTLGTDYPKLLDLPC